MKKFLPLLALVSTPALAQTAFPTPNGPNERLVAAVVPLQCDANNANCSPVSAANPPPVQGTTADSAALVGNGVPVACKYYVPASVGTNDVFTWRCTASGTPMVAPALAAAASDAMSNTASYTTADSGAGYPALSMGLGFNGSTWDRLRGDTNGLVVQAGLSSTIWNYSNGATGILSNTTTAVTIKTAAGASVRNYIDSCQINTTAFGASVPIAIRDGAGGTVLFAMNVPTAGFLQPATITFATPLKGTANTLLEVVTTTANTSGTAWVSCQGHTGA